MAIPPDHEKRRFVPEPRGIGTREQLVLDTIQQVEVPLLQTLKRTYPERGWRICGPASITLSHILSHVTGIPIRRGGTDEHIELELGIYDPRNHSQRAELIEEQTYIRYYNGQGDVYYIDPIFGLLMEGQSDLELKGAIKREKYTIAEIDQELVRLHDLHPFDRDYDGIELCGFFASMSPDERQSTYDDFTTIYNDRRVMRDFVISDSGRRWFGDASALISVIQTIVPEWRPDPDADLDSFRDFAEDFLRKEIGDF